MYMFHVMKKRRQQAVAQDSANRAVDAPHIASQKDIDMALHVE